MTYAVLMLMTVVAGLVWRMAPLGLSPFWFKYGGSALWAMALYWLIAACLPQVERGGVGVARGGCGGGGGVQPIVACGGCRCVSTDAGGAVVVGAILFA